MRDPFLGKRNKRARIRLVEVDSWVDHTLFAAGRSIRYGYQSFSTFMNRFHVGGFRRLLTELASDGASFAVLGGMLMLFLAQPAFDETTDDWLHSSQYSVRFTDRYGNEIGQRGVLHNDSVPLDEFPDHMVQAVLATEDRRFFDHFGIDIIGLIRAMSENVRANDVVQGGSSITQQLAKNLFLTSERTLSRKIKEAFLALWLETRLTKREILKLYLDRAYLGGGTVGAEAAADYYFDKSVRDVTIAEAAMLAGLFKAPSKFAPHVNLPAARARANEVLSNMVEAEFMTEGQVFGARQNPATPVDRSDNYVPNYFLDWAFREAQRISNGREYVLNVRTTIDIELQQLAENVVEASLRQFGRRYGAEQGAMVVNEHDGAVRAMVGGRDYGESQFNRATDALRQPGSSFKPYVYMTAMMNGFTPRSVVVDAPIRIGNWSPRNYGRSYRGPVTLMTALTKSINTIPVRLSRSFGVRPIVETAHLLGIRSNLLITRSLPLGVAEVTVLDQTGAYTVFANGGRRATPYGILEIRDNNGNLMYSHGKDGPKNDQIVDPEYAGYMNSMLTSVVEFGTGRRAQLDFTVAGGKTGTTQAYRDAWFMGYTGKYVVGVWFGNDDFTSTRRMTGGSLPAMTWKQFMISAHRDYNIPPMIGAMDPRGLTRQQAVLAAAANAEAGTGLGAETATLSPSMLDRLTTLEDMFRSAPAVRVPDTPTVSTPVSSNAADAATRIAGQPDAGAQLADETSTE